MKLKPAAANLPEQAHRRTAPASLASDDASTLSYFPKRQVRAKCRH